MELDAELAGLAQDLALVPALVRVPQRSPSAPDKVAPADPREEVIPPDPRGALDCD